MKRLLGLLLALAVLLPACPTLASASVPGPAIHADYPPAVSVTAGQSHCPADAPSKQCCIPSADQQANIVQVAPRPDAAGAFGALPVTNRQHFRATGPRQARAPDLHALSISRT